MQLLKPKLGYTGILVKILHMVFLKCIHPIMKFTTTNKFNNDVDLD